MNDESGRAKTLRSAFADYRPHVLFFFTYLSSALFGPFLARYLDHVGFSKSGIGFLLGWSPVVALLVQPVWGMLGDRVRVKNRLLWALLAANIVIIALLPLGRGVAWVTLLLVLLKVFQGPASNMSNTVALDRSSSIDRALPVK